MQAQPRSAINELSDERMAMWRKFADTHLIDEVQLRRLTNNIDRFLESSSDQVAIGIAFHEKAYLAAYQSKKAQALELFGAAERSGLPPMAVAISKTHALYICGDIAMSQDVISQIDLSTVDAAALAGLGDSCMHNGFYRLAADLYLKSGKHRGEVGAKALIAAEIMADIGATDEQAHLRITAAANLVKSMSAHPLIAYDLFAMHGEGLLFRFVVKDDIGRLMEIDAAIDAMLAERFSDEIDDVLSIGVCPHEPGSSLMSAEGYYVGV